MGKRSNGVKGLAVSLIVSMMFGLAPTAVWAEAASQIGSALASLMVSANEDTWADGPDRTQSPQYYTFGGEQVLAERPDIGPDRSGMGGLNLKMSDTAVNFPVNQGQLSLKWTDTLKQWIDSQNGEPVNAPAGYTVSVKLEDILGHKTYTLIDGKVDVSGSNTFVWDGKDDQGKDLPDGYYRWQLSAEPISVNFKLPPANPGDEPTVKPLNAPSYFGEKQLIVLDRTAPVIVGVHPLGGGKLAVEASDFVGGISKLTVEAATSTDKSWTENQPLRVAVAVQPGDAQTLHLSVEDAAGNKTEETLPVYPYVSGTGDADSVPSADAAVAGNDVRINLATGNGMQKFDGFVQERPGSDLDFYLTYNHQNRINGKLGYGWNFSLDSWLTKWADDNITWTGFDGTLYWFKPDGGNDYVTYANGQVQHYPKLTFDPDSSSADRNAFIMEWPNQLRYRFHNDGRFWLIQNRNTVNLKFEWEDVPTSYGTDSRIHRVYDLEKKDVVTFNYETTTGDLNSTVIADVDGLGNELPTDKRKFFFMYDSDGRFVGYREPSWKVTRFVYDSLHRIAKVIDNGDNDHQAEGTTPESVTTAWTYDDHNRVTRMAMQRKQDGTEEFLGVDYGSGEAKVNKPSEQYKLRWDDKLHPVKRVETVQNAEGTREATTSYAYNANNLIRVTDPLGRVTRYLYNEADNLAGEQSPSGRITRYTYDDDQDLIEETGPLGHRLLTTM